MRIFFSAPHHFVRRLDGVWTWQKKEQFPHLHETNLLARKKRPYRILQQSTRGADQLFRYTVFLKRQPLLIACYLFLKSIRPQPHIRTEGGDILCTYQIQTTWAFEVSNAQKILRLLFPLFQQGGKQRHKVYRLAQLSLYCSMKRVACLAPEGPTKYTKGRHWRLLSALCV